MLVTSHQGPDQGKSTDPGASVLEGQTHQQWVDSLRPARESPLQKAESPLRGGGTVCRLSGKVDSMKGSAGWHTGKDTCHQA